MLKSRTAGYRKYFIGDTIPNINAINEKRKLLELIEECLHNNIMERECDLVGDEERVN